MTSSYQKEVFCLLFYIRAKKMRGSFVIFLIKCIGIICIVVRIKIFSEGALQEHKNF